VGAIALLSLLLRAPNFGLSDISWDEPVFALVGREILNGHWPFTAVFDHKPVGLYLHFAAAIALFGDNPTASRILGWIVVTVTALAVRYILASQVGLRREAAFVVAVAYLFAALGFGGDSAASEHFANLYVTACALLLFRNGWPATMLAGVSAGLAIGTSYLAILLIGGLFAGYLATQAEISSVLRSVAQFTAGALLSIAALHAPIFVFADPNQYFVPQLSFLAGYGDEATITQRLIRLVEEGAPLIPLVAAGLAMVYLSASPHRHKRTAGFGLRPLVGMGVGAAFAIMASGYVFPNYFLLALPPLFLWSGALWSRARQRAGRVLFGVAIASTAVTIGIPGMAGAAIGAADLLAKARGDLRFDQTRQIARIAAPKLQPGDTIYEICTPPVIYQLLRVRPPTKYPVEEQLLVPRFADALRIDVDEELEAVFAKRPAVVILGDVENCWQVPESEWQRVRDKAAAHGYRPFARLHNFLFLEPAR